MQPGTKAGVLWNICADIDVYFDQASCKSERCAEHDLEFVSECFALAHRKQNLEAML